MHSPIPISPEHEIAEIRREWWVPGSDDENNCWTWRPATLTGFYGPGTFEIARLNSAALLAKR